MDKLRIISLNARGLKNKTKRIAIFRFLKLEKIDIACIQEAHVTKNDVVEWERQWGGKIYFHEGTNCSRGEMILFSKHFGGKINVLEARDRMIILSVKCENWEFAIVNAYAPNQMHTKITFFKDLENTIMKYDLHNVIMMGDFNSVLNNKQDIISGNPHNTLEIKHFVNMVSTLRLHDCWRIIHPDEKDFTFNRLNPPVARRLDYCLVSEEIIADIVFCEHLTVAQTDHKAVVIELNKIEFQRGPGYWRFNNSFLKDTDFVHNLNTFIENTLEFEDISSLPAPEKWDLLKIEIRDFCIEYGKMKSRERAKELLVIQTNIKETEKRLVKDPNNEELNREYLLLKQKLELVQLHKAKGAQIRSRIKWIEEGEKNTKFFCNLEKSRAKKNIITSLEADDGTIIIDQEQILNEQVSFYSKLYSQKPENENTEHAVNEFMQNMDFPRLKQEEAELCEGKITFEETTYALSQMKNGSAPGCDGLTVEFIKFFWSKIGKLITDSFTEAYLKGELSYLQKKGIIVLIHKGKDLRRDKLSNWRPITLTNTDYKILAKTLALRMSAVIHKLVNEDQVGYIKGRNIAATLRTIDDVINYLNKTGKSGYLLAIDFAKAFDSISKPFLLHTFKVFGFGDEFQKWVSVLLKGSTCSINYSGWLSNSFDVSCGIRQGCPFSPLAFVLAVELMAIKIRCSSCKGISYPSFNHENQELKIKQLADDTTLFLKDSTDMAKAQELINQFGKFSGLKMNENKTNAMQLGQRQQEDNVIFRLVDSIKILGIYFENGKMSKNIEKNWTARIDKLRNLIKAWSKRDLSHHGKITVIKTFLISQFTFVMQSVGMPDNILKDINLLLYKFFWKKRFNNKKAFEKIKRRVLQSDYSKGGLRMVDMTKLQTYYYLQWAGKYDTSENKNWTLIPSWHLQKIASIANVFDFNCKSTEALFLNRIENEFWQNVVCAVLDNKVLSKVEDINEHNILNQLIFNNTCIKYKGSTLFFSTWQKKGIEKLRHIVNTTEKRLLTMEEIKTLIGEVHPRLVLEYNALVNALPRTWKDIIFLISDPLIEDTEKSEVYRFNTKPKFIQEMLERDREIPTPHAYDFWRRKTNFEIDEEVWLIARNTTKEVRLLELHWKVIHNIYPTNILLNKMKIADTNKCCYCINHVDFLEHFFCHCDYVKPLWKYIEQTAALKLQKQIHLSEVDIIFGFKNKFCNKRETNFVNYVVLLGKMCISIAKKTHSSTPLNFLFDYHMQLRQQHLVHFF
jgi:exonuclease III